MRNFRRRSRAAKKGWRRRKAREKIEAEAKKQVTPKKAPLREWIVVWRYNVKRTRSVDFYVIARSKEDAELFVVKAVAKGQDSNGADLTWMAKIPWDERESYPIEEEQEPAASVAERRRLGEGWTEVR